MKMENCRAEIDLIDAEIVKLLNRRADIVKNIGNLKAQAGLPILDAEREHKIYQNVRANNKGKIPEESIVKIFRAIICESLRLQIENQTAKKAETYR